VENAIRHGIATQPAGGTLTVSSRLENDALILTVADDGAGTDPNIVASASGVGVRAVRQRLEARFGVRARLAVRTAPGDGFIVTIQLPAHAAGVVAPAPANA
jgi:sensor histidine kinase YesM